jgi:hypothetical protein
MMNKVSFLRIFPCKCQKIEILIFVNSLIFNHLKNIKDLKPKNILFKLHLLLIYFFINILIIYYFTDLIY